MEEAKQFKQLDDEMLPHNLALFRFAKTHQHIMMR